jgi:tRNA 2-selenouridine synthase
LANLQRISDLDFEQFFAQERKVLDVRAPIEFEKARIPGAVNIPILNNEDRADVGTCYKNKGSAAAIELGESLVSGKRKANLISEWLEVIDRENIEALYCARGGMRSAYAQEWLEEAGVSMPRIAGGYKGIRSFLQKTIEREASKREFLLVAGKTGVGKTRFLENQRRSGYSMLHLEEIARHRGSAFGAQLTSQPPQALFENTIALSLLRMTNEDILVESESRTIGSMRIPDELFTALSQAACVVLELDLDSRVEATIEEYVVGMKKELEERQVTNSLDVLRSRYRDAIMRISKRLGGLRSAKLLKAIDDAFVHYASTGDASIHASWVEPLLLEYYDPMYAYSLEKNRHRILFQGNEKEIEDFVRERFKRNNERRSKL